MRRNGLPDPVCEEVVNKQYTYPKNRVYGVFYGSLGGCLLYAFFKSGGVTRVNLDCR